MKSKALITLVFLSHGLLVSAQVFNTASTLRVAEKSMGIEPSIYADSDIDPNLFFHAGIGIVTGTDFAIKLGVMGDQVYLGGDLEYALTRNVSIAAGAHSYGSFGVDGTFLYSITFDNKNTFYTGVDADVNFVKEEVYGVTEKSIEIPVWIPLGMEIPIKKHILFLFETEISLTNAGSHFLGTGLTFLF